MDISTFTTMRTFHITLNEVAKDTCHEDNVSAEVQTTTDVEKDGKRSQSSLDSPVQSDFPDGGLLAWLVVCGAMCNTFATFGYVNSWGVFQSYYQETVLRDSSPSSIAWIGSIQYALVFIPGLIVGRCFDLGYFRSIFFASSAFVVGATFLIPECKSYWQFLLCQGVVLGLGCGGIFAPTPAVVAHWFKSRRGFAMGFVAVGASIGGTILPIAARNLLPRVGFTWTMRIFGFILLAVLGVSNLLMKRRLPPRDVGGGILNIRAFESFSYSVYCCSAFVTFLGIYTLLTYICTTATAIGIPAEFAFYFVAIANSSSLFGRICAGALCDKVGPLNVMIPFTAVAGILTYAWPFANNKPALVGIAVVYGFSSGAYLSLLSNPLMEMGNTLDDIGVRVGMFMTIMAVGALAGPPISGAIATKAGFKAVGCYAGTCVMVGVGLMCFTRALLLRTRDLKYIF